MKPNLKFFIAIIWCTILSSVAAVHAQADADYIHLSDPAGKMGRSVFGLAKDHNGFLWIASRSGITRYDGHNYRHYALAESEVLADRDGQGTNVRNGAGGRIWSFTTSGKIYSYDAYSDSFELMVSLVDNFPTIQMYDLFEDEAGIWIATSYGLFTYDPGSGDDPVNITGYTHVNCIFPLDDSLFLIGTTKGVFVVDRRTATVAQTATLPDQCVTSIFVDEPTGLILMGTLSNGILVWDKQRSMQVDMPLLSSMLQAPVKTIRRLDENTLLAGLDGRGVYRVNISEGSCELYISADEEYGGVLRANNVYTILVDNKNIWVGTYTGGVTLVRNNETFEWVRHIPHQPQSVRGTHIYAIHEDRDGDMWYATNQGVSFYNTTTRGWKHFLEKDNSFLTICEDKEGLIWTGGYNTGLYVIDKRKGVVRFIPSLNGGDQLDCVYSSYCDENGDLWFGCLRTPLARVSGTGNRETVRFYDILSVKSISDYDEQRLFIATSNGFYLLDKESEDKTLYFDNVSNKSLRYNSFVYSALKVGKDLWFGTDGGGMIRFDTETAQIENFSTYQGLPSNFIYGIIKDERQMLWVSTSNGLFCFDPLQRKFLFNLEDLPTRNFLFMSFTRLRDGRMAFGGTEGAVIFDASRAWQRNNATPDTLAITDFNLFYQKITPRTHPRVLPRPIGNINTVELKHDQNSFSMAFVSPDIYATHRYTYRYKLEGFDESWTTAGATLAASYTNIPPGRYVFRVTCSNGDDDSTVESTVDIHIRQPFWNTGWAWVLYVLLTIGVVAWTWTYSRELMRKKQSKEKIDFFVNIAHDIRTPLSLVLGPLESLNAEPELSPKGRRSLDLARKNGGKLMAMVTQLLDFHKDTVSGNMRHSNLSICNLNEVLRGKVAEFRQMAQDRGIAIRLEMPPERIYIETRIGKLERILDNLLSNALKYSGVGEQVIVRLSEEQRKVTIEIQDFGIGIGPKEQNKIFKQIYRAQNAVNSQETGSGIGLVYGHKLARQIWGNLSFSSEENKGTTFFLTFRKSRFNMRANDGEAAPALSAEKNRQFFTESYSILLVEDNDDMRNYLVEVLSGEYKLHSVSSAEEAREFFSDNMADLVISDIKMEGMGGDELCGWLKNNIKTSHVFVILLTAVAGKESMMRGLALGADDYITKPFDVDVLKMKIKNTLISRAKLRQSYISANKLPVPGNRETDAGQPNEGESLDDKFLSKCIAIVNENISNSQFSVTDLCSEMAMSRTLIYEKLKALIGKSPNEFITRIRLRRASELLEQDTHTIAEVATLVGISDPKYFSTLFKKHYGVSPSKVKPSR